MCWSFCPFYGLPAGCVCVALPAAPRTSRKNMSWKFWSTYPMGFIVFCYLLHNCCISLSVLRYPSRVRVCCAACGAQNLQKKHVPEILEHIPYGFSCFLLSFGQFVYLFVGFGVSQQGACLLRCLRRPEPSEKRRPWIFEDVPYGFYYFYMILWKFPSPHAPRQVQTCQI